MGLPEVRYPDGTEIAPHLDMRIAYGLYAGVRPVKAYPNAPVPLADPRAKDIDLIVLRECTEGLFASRGIGKVENDQRATDTLVITRAVCEKLFDQAFKLARRRKEKGGKGKVTCVDKSNVFVSYAFFRKIFDEVAAKNTDIEKGYSYVDAMALDLVRKPWEFDVLVAENMFADILSDLGGGIVGGMGHGVLRRDRRRPRAVPACPRHRARHRGAGQGQPHGDLPGRRDDARMAGRTSREPVLPECGQAAGGFDRERFCRQDVEPDGIRRSRRYHGLHRKADRHAEIGRATELTPVIPAQESVRSSRGFRPVRG